MIARRLSEVIARSIRHLRILYPTLRLQTRTKVTSSTFAKLRIFANISGRSFTHLIIVALITALDIWKTRTFSGMFFIQLTEKPSIPERSEFTIKK